MSPRRTLLTILGSLVLVGLIAIAILLATFDLNRYRSELAQGLEAAINRPVQLGEARLSLRHGLALDFADLRIGPAGAGAEELTAAHLFLKIDPLHLLKRQITFQEIVVDTPRLDLTLEPTSEVRPPQPLLVDLGLLETILVRSLKVENGSLSVRDRRRPARSIDFEAEHIEGQISDLSLNRTGHIALSADLLQDGEPANVRLTGEVTPPPGFPLWRGTRLALALELQHLDTGSPLPRYAATGDLNTSGRLSLELVLDGSPATGLRIDGELTGEELTLRLPALYRNALSLRRLEVAGVWTAAADSHRFSDLELTVDGLSLDGALSLQDRDGTAWLEGNLSSPGLELSRLRRFIPDRKASPAAAVKERLAGGTLQLAALRFSGPLAQFRRFDADFPLQEAAASVRNGAVRLGSLGMLEDIDLTADWRENHLNLTGGRALFAGAPLHFSGTLARPPQGAAEITLEARGTLPAERLLSLVAAEKRQGVSASGPIHANAALAGTTERLLLDLQADLSHLTAQLGEKLNKPAGLAGNLFLTGEFTPGRLELSHSRLAVAPLELRARGSLERGRDRSFTLAVDVAPLDLEQAREHTSLLERFAPRGAVALHYEVEGREGRVERREGTVSLRDFGLHLRGAVADVNQANGEILIRNDRAEASHLTARLGTSLVEIDGSLENFADPRIELRIRGRAIRADELIFPSDRAVLRDVDGRLVISKEGLDFDPVRVRLDGGTQATVQGTLRNFKAPRTTLEIEASYGNIDEVIGLWQRSPEKPRIKKKGRGKGTLLIRARAKEGNLWDLPFQDAEGEITIRNGALVIEPLRFRSGSGSCTAQVAVDNADGAPSLLKISGHLDNFDAATLHHELLKKRGLVTGTLSGDFYLEGRAGKDFLATSLGGFSLKVKDGVLRKFTVLSKVFSLLNVSQIFSLRLPDMDQEGMPFERLSGSLSLRNGILTTEDLFVKSNAMNLSVVGNADLTRRELDLVLGVKPLRTVDKIVTQIPLAGWLLTGEEKALITAHFQVRGKSDAPEVLPIPITSVSEKVLGVFKRVLGLPGKVVTDVEKMLEGEQQK